MCVAQLSRADKHQLDFRWQRRPQTVSWPSIVTQSTDINTASGLLRTIDRHPQHWTLGLIIASGGYTCHSHQHDPQPQAANQEDITKTSVSGIESLHPHGSQASSLPGVTLGTIDTNMASCANMDHDGPLRRFNPFLISGIVVAHSQGNPMKDQLFLGLGLHLHKLQAATHHPVYPTTHGSMSASALSLLPVPASTSPVLPLSIGSL